MPRQAKQFLLGQTNAVLGQLFLELTQTLNRPGNGFPVGQHAAKPAVIDEILAGPGGRFGDGFGGLPLGADEQHPASPRDGVAHRLQGAVQQRHGLLQVEDVNIVSHTEDV